MHSIQKIKDFVEHGVLTDIDLKNKRVFKPKDVNQFKSNLVEYPMIQGFPEIDFLVEINKDNVKIKREDAEGKSTFIYETNYSKLFFVVPGSFRGAGILHYYIHILDEYIEAVDLQANKATALKDVSLVDYYIAFMEVIREDILNVKGYARTLQAPVYYSVFYKRFKNRCEYYKNQIMTFNYINNNLVAHKLIAYRNMYKFYRDLINLFELGEVDS